VYAALLRFSTMVLTAAMVRSPFSRALEFTGAESLAYEVRFLPKSDHFLPPLGGPTEIHSPAPVGLECKGGADHPGGAARALVGARTRN
jgi:hypothetical protein